MKSNSAKSVICGVAAVICLMSYSMALAVSEVDCPDGPRPELECESSFKQSNAFLKLSASFLHWLLPNLEIGTKQMIQIDGAGAELLIQSEKLCQEYNSCVITAQEYKEARTRLMDGQRAYRLAMAEAKRAGFDAPEPPPDPQGQATTARGVEEATQALRRISVEYDETPPETTRGIAVVAVPKLIPTARGDGGQAPGESTRGSTDVDEEFPPPYRVRAGLPPMEGSEKMQMRDRILKPLIQAAQEGILSTPYEDSTSLWGWLGQVAKTALMSLGQNLFSELEDGILRGAPERVGQGVMLGNVVYEDTGYGSSLGVTVKEQLAQQVERSEIVRGQVPQQSRSVDPATDGTPRGQAQASGVPLVLEGKVWDLPDRVEVSASLVDSRTGQVVTRAVRRLDKSTMRGIGIAPDNLAAAMKTDKALGDVVKGAAGDSTLRVTVATDRGRGAIYTEGDMIRVSVQPSQDCYLKLFYIQADQTVVRIFPNEQQKDSRVAGGRTTVIPATGAPFKFEVRAPFGVESIVAVCSREPLPELPGQTAAHEFRLMQDDAQAFAIGLRGIAVAPVGGGRQPTAVAMDRVILTTTAAPNVFRP